MTVRATTHEYDVVVAGYGPTGQTLAALLGSMGHRVGVFERHPELFGLSRATHIDDEVMRVFQGLGIADELIELGWRVTSYGTLDAERRPLRMFDWTAPGPSGWGSHFLFYQPDLEAALDRAVRARGSVDLHQGVEIERFSEGPEGVAVTVRDRGGDSSRSVDAAYLVGADGANSTVREVLEIEREDLGFSEQWLVIDVRPHDPEVEWDMAESAQICDPKQPVTAIRRLGHKHCRWEFMLMPGQSAEQMECPEKCWELIADWGPTPENSELIRHAVYRFRSLIAEEFGRGRVWLAGDAGHLMPPFMGQGMCSGIRDAAGLAWRLDLLLRGVAPAALLDSYAAERRPHVRALTEVSIALGEVVCMTDERAAAVRDVEIRATAATPEEPPLGLAHGLLSAPHQPERHPAVGQLSRQGAIRLDGREGRFDDVVGGGWALILAPGQPAPELDSQLRQRLGEIGVRTVQIGLSPDDADVAVAADLDGTYRQWFDELAAAAVLVRPDFYVFGVARSPEEIGPLGEELVEALAGRQSREKG